jgi:hypothetical protein
MDGRRSPEEWLTDDEVSRMRVDPTTDPGFDIFEAAEYVREHEHEFESFREYLKALNDKKDEPEDEESEEEAKTEAEEIAERVADKLKGLINT